MDSVVAISSAHAFEHISGAQTAPKWYANAGRVVVLCIVVLAFMTEACNFAATNRVCSNWPRGILFGDNDRAYVASIAGPKLMLWTIDLQNNQVTDLEIEANELPSRSSMTAIWERAGREEFLRRTWVNKVYAEGIVTKEVQTKEGTIYSLVSRGEVLQIDMTKNGASRTVLRKESDADFSAYSAAITLVADKVYVLLGMTKYSSDNPQDRRTIPRGAVLYALEAETGEVATELDLWPEAIAGLGNMLAQGPNGKLYAVSGSSDDILVIDPIQDKVTAKITLCR